MEISKGIKKTVIIVSDDSQNYSDIKDIIEENYNLIVVSENLYSFEYISENISHFSALIISSKKASENN